MGLDTSHNCWSGPYSAFNRWRQVVAKAAGVPPLDTMKGFGGDSLWEELPPRPLHLLLNHSDCDGVLRWEDCAAIADDLESILDDLETKGPFSDRECAARWIRGLRKAAAGKQDVDFH